MIVICLQREKAYEANLPKGDTKSITKKRKSGENAQKTKILEGSFCLVRTIPQSLAMSYLI
jgi:hypothetical protein